MPYFTGLDRVAKTTGYPVVEVVGWRTRGHGSFRAGASAVVHHTAGSARDNFPSHNVLVNGREGLPGPLCNYGIGRDGTVYIVAAGWAAHAGKDSQVSATRYRNPYAIGIECENTGVGERWGAAQLDSMTKLCRALSDEFGFPVSDVVGHKEIALPKGRKIDPNFSANNINMTDFRRAVQDGAWRGFTVDPVGDIQQEELTMPQYNDLVQRLTRLQSDVDSLKNSIQSANVDDTTSSGKAYQTNVNGALKTQLALLRQVQSTVEGQEA